MSEWVRIEEYESGRDLSHTVWAASYDRSIVRGGWWDGLSRELRMNDGIATRGWFLMRRDDVDKPEPPEPEKPDIQRVREWLWPERDYNKPQYGDPYPTGKAELWDIETELHRRVDDLHPTFEGEGWWRYRMARHPLGRDVSIHDAPPRGEALLKAAKWLMGQEGSDGR